MSEPQRPLLLAITGNQTLTEKVLERRGHRAKVAAETRIQDIHGRQVERQVNLLGGTIAVSEPDDYREVLEATGIICLVSRLSGEPLRISQEEWDGWMADMAEERQKRQDEIDANRAVKGKPPCSVGDRVVVRWSKDHVEEGICQWIGKKYLRIAPLHGSRNVITAPFSLVVRSADDELSGRAADGLPPANRRRKRGGKSRGRRHLDKIRGLNAAKLAPKSSAAPKS